MTCTHKIIRHEPHTVDGKIISIAVSCEICGLHFSNVTPDENEYVEVRK